ncbi:MULTISPECIES: potassium channel family protein [Bacillota]|jgi:trk system potassium uptake protein|uniref:TrkA family potassium uptake protein n=2 Tax=Amedibacillus TaxID=2749846 RepID=A0A7G9GJQ7_9FIRM|nr:MULTISPECIES: TrkA family potassium uptake protein [Bacillota]QNM11039.1 TrkA family potassium uptake protein [[Eubacterium] hominis]MCH4286469.1 TrkA family potassium uptake protein [Amedibacillus hominis]RGB58528.1 TrkA family potassium uptake protein [Absiella sp. AM22-9]RGB63417.1 TrkA family potassium uptake protein [Absiella sp. AM10-20]RGB66237.1 TrkA family potassium uptake protein [Absiella sp. AM09-45]
MKKYQNRQYAVLGLGIFGSTVAKTLSKYNAEVIAVDIDQKCVNRMADVVTQAMQCDITDIDQLRAAGIQDCDVAVVSMGNHLEQSVMAIINLKELGIPYIVAKAKNKRYMQIFSKIGANKVVRPEKEMGEQVAKGILGKNIIDIIDLDSEYSVVEIPAPKEWTGKTLIDLNLRRKYGINVIGIRNHVTGDLNVCPEPECTIEKDDHIVLIADGDAINKFDNMID